MGEVHVRTLMRCRIEALLKEGDGIEAEEWEEGGWGLITIRDGGALVGFEFLETDDSWTRDEAPLQYMEAASDGFTVTVLVPEELLDEVSEAMGPAVRVATYEGLGLRPRQMA